MKRLSLGRTLTFLLPVLTLTGGGLLPVARAGVVSTLNPAPKADKDGSADFQGGRTTAAGTSAATVTMPTASGGTLTVGGITVPYALGGTLTLNGSETYTAVSSVNFGNSGGATATKTPALSGTAGELKVGTSADGSKLRVKTSVTVTNSGTKAAKGVTATVYLSDDAVLDTTEDTKIATLALKDFYPETAGTIGKKQTLTLPIKHSVPAALADYVNGKYLIVVLDATNTVTQGKLSAGSITLVNPSSTGSLTTFSGLTGLTSTGLSGVNTLLPGTYPLANGGVLTLTTPVTISSNGTVGTVGTTVPTGGTVTATAPVVTITTAPVTATPVSTAPVATTPPKAVVPANEIIIGPIHLP